MKNIENYIKPENISLNLQSNNKPGLIQEMISLLDMEVIEDRELFERAVFIREELGSTGVGHGVAIPHGKSRAVKQTSLAFGRCLPAIDYDSLDNEPVSLIFMVASPEGNNTEYIKILACIAGMMKDEQIRQKLLKISSVSEVWQLIVSYSR